MIVFFSFFQREKDKHYEAAQSVIANTNSLNLQAIIVPENSSSGIGLFWVKKFSTKFPCLDYNSGKILILNKLKSSCYNSYQLAFHSNNPIVSIFHLQKVPEQGNEDDVLSIT